MSGSGLPVDVGAGKAHAARAYDWYLGGKDNFEADRELGRLTEQTWPTVRVFARENRLFMQRAVRYLAEQENVRQYLDIGSGIPTAPNVHEIAQRVTPASRVVYVDNDPMVISHARSLLRSSKEGRAAYLYDDIREPEKILAGASEVLDFSEPVAVLVVAVLHFVPDEWNPGAILGTLLGELPAGSFLVASHITEEFDPVTISAAAEVYRRGTGLPAQARTREEFEKLAFTSQGLEVIEPGVALVSEWRDAERPRPTPQQVSCFGAVGRKLPLALLRARRRLRDNLPVTKDFSIKPTLTGEKAELRPFRPGDLEQIRDALRDPEVLRLTGSVHDENAEASGDERALRDWYESRNDQPDRLDLAITDLAGGACVGEAVLNEWDSGSRSCNFRILIGPAGRGRGLGTEATRLIVGYGFEQLGLHRISLEVYSFNPRARHVYESMGFRAEGVLRESLRYGDQWIDATVMSILDREWAVHRGYP